MKTSEVKLIVCDTQKAELSWVRQDRSSGAGRAAAAERREWSMRESTNRIW